MTGLYIMQKYEDCSVALLKSKTLPTKQQSLIGSNTLAQLVICPTSPRNEYNFGTWPWNYGFSLYS